MIDLFFKHSLDTATKVKLISMFATLFLVILFLILLWPFIYEVWSKPLFLPVKLDK